MGRRAWIGGLGLAALLACGSKTGLLPGGAGGGGASSSGSGGGGGPTPLAVKCAAPLLDGAPTPMRGYCPTRANQAAMNGPRAPTIAWSVTPLPIEDPESFLPAEVVVDATGRAYVAIDASPLNPAGAPNQVFAIDADGRVAWTGTFTGPVSSLVLASDGSLWVMGTLQGAPPNPACQTTGSPKCLGALTALSHDGVRLREVDPLVPPAPPYSSIGGYTAMALGSDGTFFLESASDSGNGGGLARAALDGTLLWQWPAGSSSPYVALSPPLLVGPADDVVSAGGGEAVRFDAAGDALWRSRWARASRPRPSTRRTTSPRW